MCRRVASDSCESVSRLLLTCRDCRLIVAAAVARARAAALAVCAAQTRALAPSTASVSLVAAHRAVRSRCDLPLISHSPKRAHRSRPLTSDPARALDPEESAPIASVDVRSLIRSRSARFASLRRAARRRAARRSLSASAGGCVERLEGICRLVVAERARALRGQPRIGTCAACRHVAARHEDPGDRHLEANEAQPRMVVRQL
jgi:hypothetical protein